MKIGIISDTHGLLRPEVLAALQNCDVILHGGDINRQDILDELSGIAPLHVVRGNNDREWAAHIPMYLDFTLAGLRVYMTHKKKDLPGDLSGYDLVVYGHSHKFDEAHIGNTLLLNPGSCGPRRFNQPITMAVVEVNSIDGRRIMQVSRIEIPHAGRPGTPNTAAKAARVPAQGQDLRVQIETVMRETERGYSIGKIASRHQMDETLVTQIVRLYLTHPGVTADGILNKMGL